MPDHAEAWWDDLRQEAELPPDPPRARKTPVIVGALVAVAASAGLGWWLSSPTQSTFESPVVLAPAAPPQVVRAGSLAADEEQVRRAYEEFSLVYANSGPGGLARFSQSCQQSLQGDPRILDFCLAFDLFAESVGAGADASPPGKAEARRVAMVQAALPSDADPDRRIEEVLRLMRVASGVAEIVETSPPPGSAVAGAPPGLLRASRAVAAPAAPAQARAPVRLTKADPRRPVAKAADPCRFEATPADRLLCATPALRRHETGIRQAYERALAAGADPLMIDRGQAEWRAARNDAETAEQLAESYIRRIRELEAAAEAAPRTPPS